jgi:iron complex outermembrane receptor protein
VSNNKIVRSFLVFVLLFFLLQNAAAQKNIQNMSKDEISQLTQEELLEMPLEDLMVLVNRFKLSSLEELYEKVLNPKISTASKFDEELFASPVSTFVINAEEIMASGALNIPEVLRMAPGMIVRQKTNGNYDVHIRGNDNIPSGQTLFYSENSLTLVMIDDRPVYNHFQGGTFWETLPVNLQNIERIEIVYGPSSSLYGPNAVSGVIHIFTKKEAVDGFQSEVQAQIGANGTQDAQMSIVTGRDGFTARFTANYQKLERFQDAYYVFESFLDSVRQGRYVPSDSLQYFASNTQQKFPHPEIASHKVAANIYLNYQPQKETNISFNAGIQKSDIQSIFFDTREFSLTGRQNFSGHSSLKFYHKGLSVKTSYALGEQNLALGYPGYEFLFGNFTSSAEYLFSIKGLKVLPGINFQYVFYDDLKYLPAGETGIFNARQDLRNTAVYLRLDYNLLNKLRLTAAGRWEWFKQPKDTYFSFQFTMSYPIKNQSNIRAIYSTANRGPFMWDYHVNYSQRQEFGDVNLLTNYSKNPGLNLLQMHMFEFGYRVKVSKNITLDASYFYNVSNDYNLPQGTLYQESLTDYRLEVRKENLPLISKQMGMTASLETLLFKEFHAKLFGTLQQTNLDKSTNSYDVNDTLIVIISNDSKIHKATPTFTGGINIKYSGNSRFSAHSDFYFISSQFVSTYDGIRSINPKAVVNLKLQYNFFKEHQVFINIRNLTNNDEYEFIFADIVGTEIMAGLQLKWPAKKKQ